MGNNRRETTNLLTEILKALTLVGPGTSGYAEASLSSRSAARGNQFLLFFKPELFHPGVDFEGVFTLVMAKLAEMRLDVASAQAMSGGYLDTHQIVSRHYGVIDAVSRDPARSMSDQAKERFASLFGVSVDEAPIIGSLAYLANHADTDAATLAASWLSSGYKKLAGGTYCQHIADQDTYLVNGFYPQMLQHYTKDNSRIVSLVVSGDVSWSRARTLMIGSTNPAEAESGSIRRALLERKDELGIPAVTANLNGLHLSAGPVEGLVELMRFTTNYSLVKEKRPPKDFVFGRMLVDTFSAVQIEAILDNRDVTKEGAQISIFDLTEEKDSHEALAILESVATQLG